jgi:transcriptional regulator with XRE-family HTH domain
LPLSPLGETIERIAARRNMTRDDIAKAADLSGPSLHGILTGRTADPRSSTIARLATALGVPPATLLASLR